MRDRRKLLPQMLSGVDNKIIVGAMLLLAVMLLQGCASSTKLVNRWADADYQGEKLHKVFVIGVVKDDLMRRSFEDQFVGKLARDGRDAVASYVYMPDLKEYKDRKKLEALVKKVGADAVLVTTLQDVENRKEYVAPRVDYVPAAWGGYGYYGYYFQSMQPIYSPGYERSTKVVRLETKVFSLKTGKIVWGGVTESFNPSSSAQIIDSLVGLVVSDMKKAGLIR